MGSMQNNCQDLLSPVLEKLTAEGTPVMQKLYSHHHKVLCSWLYRMIPSAKHKPFVTIGQGNMSNDFDKWQPNPNQVRYHSKIYNLFNRFCFQIRWKPFKLPEDNENVDFVEVSWQPANIMMQHTCDPLHRGFLQCAVQVIHDVAVGV